MKNLYWKVNPKLIVNKNPYLNNWDGDFQLNLNITILCKEYEEIANEIKRVIKLINEKNFEESMIKIFDKEAYLSEIYFYLSEDILLNSTEQNILELIKKDYLLSYYWKLEEINKNENVSFMLGTCLNNKI